MFEHYDFMGWGGVMGLFWILLLLAVVWLVVGVARNRDGGGAAPSAREILDQRYARGDIDADEYRRRVDDLRLP